MGDPGRRRKSSIPEHVHGSLTGYNYYGCLCGRCRLANRLARTAHRAGLPPVYIPASLAQGVLELLTTGISIREAAAAAGMTVTALKRLRFQNERFDAAVVAAAHLGGNTTVHLLNKPPCPGPACGTDYGYDTLMCRKPDCIGPASNRRVEAVRRRPS